LDANGLWNDWLDITTHLIRSLGYRRMDDEFEQEEIDRHALYNEACIAMPGDL